MENVKASQNAEQQHESNVNEAENFEVFIKAMVQAVEKYGITFALRLMKQPLISISEKRN